MTYDFINKLGISAGIISFNGDVVEVNDWLVRDSLAHSKMQILNFSMLELMVDKSKHYDYIDQLKETKIIQGQKMLLNTLDGRIVERTFNLSLLSGDNKLILYQKCGGCSSLAPYSETTASLLKDFRKLYPYLNKAGKEVFNQIFDSHKSLVNKSGQEVQVEYFSKKINAKFPNLSYSEKYFCALILMGFSAKEIAHLDEFTLVTIRVTIHRICQKLGLDSREELFSLLKQSVIELK